MSLADATTRLATARLPAGPVGVVRIAVGIAALVRGFEAMAIMTWVFEPGRARFPYASFWPEIPSSGVGPLSALWLAFAVTFAVGWGTRYAGLGLTAVMAICLTADQQTYSNHLYLLILVVFLLTLANSGARYSLDARSGRGQTSVPAWPILLTKLQLTIVYVFAGVSKINAEYLSGTVLADTFRREGPLTIPSTWQTATLFAALSVASIASELFLAGALWSARWRRVGLAGAAMFHGLILVAMTTDVVFQMAVFFVQMVALYALCCTHPVAVVGPSRLSLPSGPRHEFVGAQPSAQT